MAESRPATQDKVLPAPGILLTRGLLYLILLLMGFSVAWAVFTKVDVVVTADGRLAPRGGAIRLSASQAGIVTEVRVQVGSVVRQDEPLLLLDTFREDSEARRLGHELEAARAEQDRLKQTADGLRQALEGAREERAREERVRSLLEADMARLKSLALSGAGSSREVETKEREVAEVDVRIARLKAEQIRADEEILRNERLALEAGARAQAIEATLARTTGEKERTTLRAPKAGTVTALAVQQPGRYLAEDEVAVVIAPTDDPLGAEVWISNKSMRRVRRDLPARIKIAAYPYQDFGVVTGRLDLVEPDADEKGNYRAWVRLDKLAVPGPQGEEQLRSGLLLTAEIVVDQRSVIEVVLDPFRRLKGGMTVSD